MKRLSLVLLGVILTVLVFGGLACSTDIEGGPSFDNPPDASPDTVPATDSGGTSSAFNVTGAASIGSTRMTVTFDAPPDPAQASTLANYAVAGLTLSGTPTLQGNVVTLTTSTQSAVAYSLTVSGVTRAIDARPLEVATATFTGRAPFNLTGASSPNSITVTLTFDAPPDAGQAAALASYNVPGLTLAGAVVDGNTVTLTTATQAAQAYTVTVSGVTRASDAEPLTSATASFNGTITFNVVSAAATKNTAMIVTFDALPNPTEAVVLANYSVPGLTLSGTPVLAANVVTIATSSQTAQPYTLTVSNVTRADGSALVTNTATFQGRSSFNVQSATSPHAGAVSVTFDAAPDPALATNIANYSVPGLTLSAAQLAANTVTLTTSMQSAQSFTVTVSGVTRASDAEPLTNGTATFTGHVPPTTIVNVAGRPLTNAAIEVTWTAPAQDAVLGSTTVAGYELRYAKTAIATVAEFLAATPAIAPLALPPGQTQTAVIGGLETATTYFVAVRALDGAGNAGAVSNNAVLTTKARAKLLITEVTVANTAAEGFDFVEAVAVAAGWAEGIEVKQLATSLYTLGPIDLSVGDRVVVHAAGLPGPPGFDQEDLAKSKVSSGAGFASPDAYDVYSATNGLTGTDTLVTVNEGTTIVDAVAISNRDNDASAATMTAWLAAGNANAWKFSVVPNDGANDCVAQRDAVNIAQPAQDIGCGGFATGYGRGLSVNRAGTTDTDTKAEWYVAAQSPGAANATPPTATILSAVPTSASTVNITFDREIALATLLPANFTIAGLAVTGAGLANVHVVTLTTEPQAGGAYQIDISSNVTTSYGSAIVPAFARFCTFSTLPALVAFNEVNTNLPSGADLLELKVTRGGLLTGYQVRLNPTTTTGSSGTLVAALPAICAATSDLVVVHMTPAQAPTAPTSETLAKDEHSAGTFAANYDGAWDVLGTNTNVAFATSLVLTIRDAAANYIEGVAFSDMSGTASSAAYLNSLAFIQAQSLWLPASCGGVACTDATTPTAKGVAASWVGVTTTLPGMSVGRSDVATQASSWAVGPSSFGQ